MPCLLVCLPVCLSRSYMHSVKTNKHTFKFFSPSGSNTILIFPYQTSQQYSAGNPPPPNGALNANWGWWFTQTPLADKLLHSECSGTSAQKAIYCHSRFTRWRGYMKMIYKTVKPMNVRSRVLSQNKKQIMNINMKTVKSKFLHSASTRKCLQVYQISTS